MTLSDFASSDCPGGICCVDFSRKAVSQDWIENEIRFLQGAFRHRTRSEYALGNESLWKTRLVPLAAILGCEPGLILISPALARWA